MEDTESFYDKLKGDASGLLLGSGLASVLAESGNVANRLFNKYTPQDVPIGEMFADFAIDDIKKKAKVPVNIAYINKYPRVPSDAVPSGFRNKLNDFIQDAFINNGANVDVLIKEGPGDTLAIMDEFRNAGMEHLNNEINGLVPADKLLKHKDATEVILKEFLPSRDADVNFIVRAPRNNIPTAAHEFGHIVNDISGHADSLKNDTLVDKMKNSARYLWQNLGVKSITESELMPEAIRNGIFDKVNRISNPLLRNAAVFLTSTSMPTALTLATMPLTSSKTVRDAIGSLDSTGNTQEVMDWIGDNAVTVSALAAAPRLIEEAATTIPGYKLTVDFWKEFNKGAQGALRDHPLMQNAASLVGKKIPWLEGLKFIGRNSLHFLPALAPVAIAAVGKAFNNEEE